MPNTPAYDASYKKLATLLAGNRTGGNTYAQFAQNIAPVTNSTYEAPKRQADWNLGQGFIDLLSSGSYAVAGIGNKIGQNVDAINKGDMGGAIDLANPLSLIGGAGKGIAERRSWSDNLKDLGADQNASTWGGLALDIALDPFWFIPGGAIAAGIKGTAKGATIASAANKAGAKLAPDAFKAANEITQGFEGTTYKNKLPILGGNIKFAGGKAVGATEDIANLFPTTGAQTSTFSGQGLNNFLQGIRQGNIEEYSNWSKLREQKKINKALKKEAKATESFDPIDYSPLETLSGGIASNIAKAGKKLEDQAGTPAERAANAIEDTVDETVNQQVLPDTLKDASSSQELVDNAVGNYSIRQMSKEKIGPVADEYIASRGIDAPKFDVAEINSKPEIGSTIAKLYDEAPDLSPDPQTLSSYRKLVEEVRDQYNYLINKKRLIVTKVDYEPYRDANGVLDSRLMMQDVAENNHMLFRSSAPDYEKYGPHPVMTVEENDMFRIVHDYFGHAASGRGFDASGEEAAWVMHSAMFSPEARRAMTTETRGQNSYYNYFDPERKSFAKQKAFLLPDEYVTTPLENATILAASNDAVLKSNSFIGRMTSLLTNFADEMIYDLGVISTPMKGVTRYTPEQISNIEAALVKHSDTAIHEPKSEVSTHALTMLEDLRKYINEPTAYNLGRLATKDSATTLEDQTSGLNGIIQLIQDAANATTNTTGLATAAAALKTRLDQPIDVTNLIIDGLKAEGRGVKAVDAFKPTVWSTKANGGYGAAEVTKAKLQRYFPDDQLLTNPQQLGIALGTLPLEAVPVAGKGDRSLLARKRQEMIWADFRTRNIDRLEEVRQLEKLDWETANSVPNSELFKVMPDGTPIGQGLLPATIPAGTVRTQNGIPRTSLSAILDNIGKVVQRAPRGMGERATNVARSMEITVDTFPPQIQKWVTTELNKIVKEIKTNGLTDTKAVRSSEDAHIVAEKILEDIPAVRSYGDALLLATGGTKALKELAKTPKQRFYIAAPEDIRTQLPDTSQIGRAVSSTGNRAEQKVLSRDPETGVPLDKNGMPATEVKAAKAGTETQFRILDDKNKAFTGRVNGSWATQSGKGAQQLAGLQAIRETLANINTGIAAKELVASPEHAQMLTSVMTMIGIKVAPDATPRQVFNLFKKDASLKFEETIQALESAAKTEAVAYQLQSVFSARNIISRAQSENISIMKAIERTNIAETQAAVVKWTDDAISLVDETCVQNYAKLDIADIVSQVRKPLG